MLNDGAVVYLPADDKSNWIASADLLSVASIRMVDSISELEDVASSPTSVIIIDREFVESVNPEWATSVLDRRVVLVAARANVFDIPGVDEPIMPGATPPSGGFPSFRLWGDPDGVWYALFERWRCSETDGGSGGGQGGLAQGSAPDEERLGLFQAFLHTLARFHPPACESS